MFSSAYLSFYSPKDSNLMQFSLLLLFLYIINLVVHMLYFCLQKGIKTNATQSIPSPVMNLCDVNSHVKLEKMLGAIGWEYLRTCPYSAEDRGEDFIGKQRGFQLINPTDQWFPGKCKLFSPFVFSLCLTYAHTLINVGLIHQSAINSA